jgi:hypothetical protein
MVNQTRVQAEDPESRDLASVALVAIDVLIAREGATPMARWLERLSAAIARADPHPSLQTAIQASHAVRDLADVLPGEAPLLVEMADKIHERAWLREHGCVPACFKLPRHLIDPPAG